MQSRTGNKHGITALYPRLSRDDDSLYDKLRRLPTISTKDLHDIFEKLGYSKNDYKNKQTENSRNGYSSKTLRASMGKVEVSVPRDRKGEFES